ncbi:MAG TPA: AHH domain-containing protein [Polyangium sp.]|nr:AHH domain-containing protein [Polyangium sp.]
MSKKYAKELKDALIAAGHTKAPGESTHHIVAHSSEVDGAELCRELFARFKLKMNGEYNGAFLPMNKNAPNPNGALVHATLDNKVYYAKLAKALGDAKTQAEAIQKLHRIREALRKGTFYHADL